MGARAVLLDVVYNHLGPEGNYLPRYAPRFFTERHRFHRTLLALRRAEIVPLLGGGGAPAARLTLRGDTRLDVEWAFPGAPVLRLAPDLGAGPVAHPGPAPGWGRRLYALGVTADTWSALPAWSAVWYLREGPTQDE